jgi:phosphatidylglycerophosphate synthase
MMNALDGLLARAQNTASAWGEILNEISDVLGDTISYGVIYWASKSQYQMIIIFIIMIWFCEFVGILGKSLPGGKRRQESLGGAKPERALAMGILSIVLYFNPDFERHYNLFFGALSFFILLTTIKRIKASIKDAKNKTYKSTTEFGR